MNYRSIAALIVFSVMTLAAHASQAAVLFQETFVKDVPKQIKLVRTFTAPTGPAVITLTNDGVVPFSRVRQGRISLNNEVVFGRQDFQIRGSVVKKITTTQGSNILNIEMSGKPGGQITISVKPGDEPGYVFPGGTIYVSSSGSDTAECGIAPDAACSAIQTGVNRAIQTNGHLVAVAAGLYFESITLASGVSVLGGFDDEFSRRHIPSMRPIIQGRGTSPATVSAANIVASTTFEGFLILGPSVSVPGVNSIGIQIRNSTDALIVLNNIILAGVAAGGGAGTRGVRGLDGRLVRME